MAGRSTAQSHADRKQHLVDAAVRVIATNGVTGATTRRVAEAARVSTGSISYYFDDKDDLYFAAFVEFVNDSVRNFERYFEEVSSLTEARAAVVRMLEEAATDHTAVVLATELYSVSLRRPRFHLITEQWSQRFREIVGRHFSEDVVFAIDSFYVGAVLHRGLRLGQMSEDRLAWAVEHLTPEESYMG